LSFRLKQTRKFFVSLIVFTALGSFFSFDVFFFNFFGVHRAREKNVPCTSLLIDAMALKYMHCLKYFFVCSPFVCFTDLTLCRGVVCVAADDDIGLMLMAGWGVSLLTLLREFLSISSRIERERKKL
jgi:hypothetical protein